MTSLFTARRRAEEFAAAVDGQTTMPVTTPEIAELLGVVTALVAHRPETPRPDFASDLRTRLMAEARTVLTPENANLQLPVRPRGTRERRLVAAASAVVLIGGTASMAAAAQSALPGDPLYPIKRGLERAEAGLSTSPAGRGRDLLNQANDRLVEIQGLLASGSGASEPRIPPTIRDFSEQAQQGTDLLLTSFAQNRDPATIVTVRRFTADSVDMLGRLAAVAPSGAQTELARAAMTLRDIDLRAADMCESCAPGLPSLTLPAVFQVRAEVDHALSGATAAGLDNSHPVVVDKGALDQARSDATTKAGGTLTGQSSSPSPSGGGTPTPGSLQPGGLPSLPLPGTDGGSAKDSNTVQNLTDSLNGAVETLLPGSGDSGGLLP